MNNVEIAADLAELRRIVANHEFSLQQYISGEFEAVKQAIEAIPARVADALAHSQHTPVTEASVARLLEENNARLLEIVNAHINHFAVDLTLPQPVNQLPFAPLNGSTYRFFTWGGKTDRYVPEDFEFPRCSVKEMWNLWYYGDVARGIHPFYRLSADARHDDLHTKDERSNLSRARIVMEALEAHAKQEQLLQEGDDISAMSAEQSDPIYYAAYNRLVEELYPSGTHRPDNVRYATIAEKIYLKRRREHPDEVKKRRRKSESSTTTV